MQREKKKKSMIQSKTHTRGKNFAAIIILIIIIVKRYITKFTGQSLIMR